MPHRDFLFKRSHIAGHGARSLPLPRGGSHDKMADPLPVSSAATSSTEVKTSAPLAPINSRTTDTPTPSSFSSSSSTTTTSSPSASISSLTSRSSSASPTSSDTLATPSATVSTLSIMTSSSATNAVPVTSQVHPSISVTPTTSSLFPTTTTTSSVGSSGGIKTSTVVGGVAGTLAGIAALGFLLMWCMRRQRSRDIDDFDAQAFKRQSVVLVDDPPEPPRSYNPRPPTMIEQHNASPALAAQAAYGGQGFHPSYGEYSQEPSFVPDMNQTAGSPASQVYGAPLGYTGYNDPQQQLVRQPSNMGRPAYQPMQQLARQPSNAQYLTRQPTSATAYAPPSAPPASLDPNVRYIDLNRSSVSPYQAAQYADISRQLGTSDPNTQAPHGSLDLPEAPLPSPFDDPTEKTAVPFRTRLDNPAAAAPPGPATMIPSSQVQENPTQPHQRPVTVYEESDAYGGI